MKIISQLVISAVAMFIIVFRDYTLFSAPRFWAEEGAIWFSHAFSHDWSSVIFVAEVGYYNFYTQLAVLLASRIVPLEHAPLVTTVMAFFVQYIAIMIVVWDNSSLWNTTLKKAVITAIIIFIPRTAEIWLNTNGSQYFFSLITILILLSDDEKPSIFKKYVYRILIFFAGLTGVLSCALTPLFFLKAWKTRAKETYVQAGALVICCVIQLLSIYIEPSRMGFPTITAAGLIAWVRVFLAPFSLIFAQICSQYIINIYRSYGKVVFHLAGFSIIVIEAAIIWILTKQIIKLKNILIVGSFLFLTFFSTYFGIGGRENMALLDVSVGNRYFYVPGVLMLLMIIFSIDFKSKKTVKNILSGILVLLMVTSCINGLYWFQKDKLKKINWTTWSSEVAIWKNKHSYRLKIWPTGWTLKLEERKN